MKTTASNKSLGAARAVKNDEFYTQYADIHAEMNHYRGHFAGKTVYCNCDDPRASNFFRYFSYAFKKLGLKKLIATCYQNQSRDLLSLHDCEKAVWLEYDGRDLNGNKVPNPDEIAVQQLKGDGDFRSDECIALLKQADIVVTNPPFSLFREYVAQLVKFNKKFLILGPLGASSYLKIFRLMKENKIWWGVNNGAKQFGKPDSAKDFDEIKDGKKFVDMGNVVWFTNLDHDVRHEPYRLTELHNETHYPKYDKYDAIEVGKVREIPEDYAGVMGVPISFLDKYNPNQFEIVGVLASAGYNKEIVGIPLLGKGDARAIVNGKAKFSRLLIRNKHPER